MADPETSHLTLQNLHDEDIILLLTPVVIPLNAEDRSDPFEILGRAIERKHARVRHVSYNK